MQHVMVDLETMGTGSYAAIVSIGAVKFDPDAPFDPATAESFYAVISLASAMKAGLRVEADTVMWWLDQSLPAVQAFTRAEKVGLDEALLAFSAWFGEESLPVWGNGATFDNVILRNAFAAVGLDCPWSYKHDRCYRTIKNLKPPVPPVEFGTAHDALDDAIAQTLTLLKIAELRRLRLE